MQTQPIHAVLQAGGRGERLGPHTAAMPKPLVRVGGVPMIERLIRQLAALGVARITVLTGYMGDQVEAHCDALAGEGDLPPIACLREAAPLGNFGGMADVQAGETILFAFADLVTDMDFAGLLEVHRGNGAAITLASHIERYRVSLGELGAEGTRVLAYTEKPVKEYIICSGMAAIEPGALEVLERGRACGISDFVTRAIAAGHVTEHWMHGATVMDVNTSEMLQAAEERFG